MKPIHYHNYWTILPSIESEGYGDTDFCEPWKARYEETLVYGLPSGRLHHISEFFPDGVDRDSNATAYADERTHAHVFESESEAWKAYFKLKAEEIADKRSELDAEERKLNEKAKAMGMEG